MNLMPYLEQNSLRADLVKPAEHSRWGLLGRWLQKLAPEPRLLSLWAISVSRLRG